MGHHLLTPLTDQLSVIIELKNSTPCLLLSYLRANITSEKFAEFGKGCSLYGIFLMQVALALSLVNGRKHHLKTDRCNENNINANK